MHLQQSVNIIEQMNYICWLVKLRCSPQCDTEEVEASDEGERSQGGPRRHHPRRQRRLGRAPPQVPEDGEGDAQRQEGRRAQRGGDRGAAHHY